MATPTTDSTSSDPIFPPPTLVPILKEVTTLLKSQGQKVCVAETAAGGLISASLLSTPGASGIYAGGLTLYTLGSRTAYAGWTSAHIDAYAGPGPAIVAGLARHARKDLGAAFAVSESGTAGPTGGATRNRTPGYVALSVDCERGTFTREVETGLGGDRVRNMVRFAEEALKFLRDVALEQEREGERFEDEGKL